MLLLAMMILLQSYGLMKMRVPVLDVGQALKELKDVFTCIVLCAVHTSAMNVVRNFFTLFMERIIAGKKGEHLMILDEKLLPIQVVNAIWNHQGKN
mmetsp:Transcript_24945/g.31409  ORF Transcript_24945/g.31409 Transcript_24945/m.31409 type:complete len:96 (-) Transcript_24945:51-338(-)